MSKRIIGWGLLGVAFVVAIVTLWLHRYDIYDWAQLRSYQPSATIASLATDSGMNDYGRRLFYVNRPEVSDRDQFNSECTTAEQTIVLGCYTGTNIYIFKVDDAKLEGVEEVTAAHEMLHAAYQRLSKSEKARIDGLVESAYKRVNDPHLTEIVASYKKTEPGQELNELHSILGTEYSNLGPELEAYYTKYFSDRGKVVTLANKYKKVFEDIQNQVNSYDADLALRKAEINKQEEELSAKAAQLAAQKAQLVALQNSGQTAAYNAQVNAYNSQVAAYNNQIASTKKLIDEYNAIVIKRNVLTVQQQNLAQSLDSRVNPIGNN